jgi:hypothetical protein
VLPWAAIALVSVLAAPATAVLTPAALEGRTPAETRFLEGRALLQAGKAGPALALLPGLREALPAVADRVDALEAQALEALGRPEAAEGAWKRIREGSLLWPEARLAQARLAVAAGRAGEAVEALRPLMALPAPSDLSRPDPAPRALLLAGTVLAGQPDGAAAARRAWVECWAGHALSAEAKECRARLATLPPPHDAPPSD